MKKSDLIIYGALAILGLLGILGALGIFFYWMWLIDWTVFVFTFSLLLFIIAGVLLPNLDEKESK